MDKKILDQLMIKSEVKTLLTDSNKVELVQHGTPLFHMSIHYTCADAPETLALYHHLHSALEFFFLLEGKLRFHTPGQRHIMVKGDMIIIQPNRLHGAFKPLSESVEFLAVTIHKEFLSSQLNDLIQQEFIGPIFSEHDTIKSHYDSDFCVQKKLNTDLEVMCHLYVTKPYGYELLIKAKLYEILYKIIEANPRTDFSNSVSNLERSLRLEKAINHIHKHYQYPIHVRELAEVLAISEGHFGRLFKSHFGMTAIEYINDYRLNMAAHLLSKGSITITEAAKATGFSNLSYFTKRFKSTFAVSPKDYKRSSSKNV